MHVITPRKRESMTLTIAAPRPRLIFVGRLRSGSGCHADRRRCNDRTAVKLRLRRGEF
jgi:hypothetical protein